MQEDAPNSLSFAAEICRSLHDLFHDTDRIAVRPYEEEGGSELIARLVPAVHALLDRAGDTMAHILEHYETESSDSFDFESTENNIIALHASASSPRIAIADLAFIAVTELRQHRQRLAALRSGMPTQEIVSGCGSALRAIKKCLYAIEPLLCQLERKPPLLPPRLETSLAVRRHYQKLWAFALDVGQVEELAIRRALRGAGTRIAILAGNDVYNLLREDDRFRLRDLQTRILSWLASSDEPLTGMRIWQDFALFVEMLRQVNLREEIVEHDRTILQLSLDALRDGGTSVEEVLPAMSSLIGADDSLDALLLGAPTKDALVTHLERVISQKQASSSETQSAAS